MPPASRRPAVVAGVLVGAAAIAAAAGLWSGSGPDDSGGGGGPAVTVTVTTPGGTPPPGGTPAPGGPPGGVPGMPDWGAVAGTPETFVVPEGGTSTVSDVAGGREVRLLRGDGSTLAVAEHDDAAGVYRSVRYFDRRGALEFSVYRVDAAPLAAVATTSRAMDGCRDVRRVGGSRWGAFPIGWRLVTRSVPRRLGVTATVRATALARRAWTLNLNRCGVGDAARSAFAYRGSSRRGIGRNGVNTVGFGEVDALGGPCRGATACTFTWARNGRAVESDVRLDRNPRYPFSVGSPVRGRADLRSVLVHESGHTLGLDHVDDRGNVMFPVISLGSGTYRTLGRGDALANNALY